MTDIKKFTSFATSNCYLISPFDNEIVFLIVYINPGHSKGSVSFEFKDLGAVFTGDFIFKDSIGRTDLYSGDNNEMIDSINNVFTLFQDDFQLFPGHGDDDTVINIKNNNPFIREYLK